MAGQLATDVSVWRARGFHDGLFQVAIGFTGGFDAKGVIVFCDKPTFVLVSRPQIRSVVELKVGK
jgi:hypothetical protein